MTECKRIADGTCKKCSACGTECEYYIPTPKQEYSLGYGYFFSGGKVRDMLPHGARYYFGLHT